MTCTPPDSFPHIRFYIVQLDMRHMRYIVPETYRSTLHFRIYHFHMHHNRHTIRRSFRCKARSCIGRSHN